MPDYMKVGVTKAKLKDPARLWWHNVDKKLGKTGERLIHQWDEMKLKMKEHFLPTD